jgi:hypothetical protein
VLLELVAERSPLTACPSEVARALNPEDWRPLMPKVREVAARLQQQGLLEVTQKGQVVDAVAARGPIRLKAPQPPSAVETRRRRRQV